MRVMLLPASVGAPGQDRNQYLTSFVINDTVAIDAGSLGLFQTPQEQTRVRHVFLTHSHVDHVGSLPIFVENVFEGKADCVTIYGSEAVLDSVQRDLFNDRIWPDFLALSRKQTPFLKVKTLVEGQTVEVDGLRLTPFPVNHVVHTFGFLVEDAASTILIPSDTGPTEEIWKRANAAANLKAVFLEVTFPNYMQGLADVAKHLTPRTFGEELRKLKKTVPIYAIHIKPRFHDEVVKELKDLGLPNLTVGRMGCDYTF